MHVIIHDQIVSRNYSHQSNSKVIKMLISLLSLSILYYIVDSSNFNNLGSNLDIIILIIIYIYIYIYIYTHTYIYIYHYKIYFQKISSILSGVIDYSDNLHVFQLDSRNMDYFMHKHMFDLPLSIRSV
jgi:amino acid transporter